jgi:putative ABC transport system permease protein
MKNMFRDLPVAWLQLSHGRAKLLAAVAGIIFADLLMWMQLGFRSAAIDSSVYIHGRLRGDLVILNPQTEQLDAAKSFPRRELVRAQGHPDVEAAVPLYAGTAQWRNPWTGVKRSLFVYGIVPYAPAISVPNVAESAGVLHEEDTCLADTKSRKDFDAVLAKLAAGQIVRAEVNSRKIKIVGTTTIGVGFEIDANIVTSDANFIRLFPERTLASVDLGVVRLRPGSDPHQVKIELQRIYGSNLLVLTTGDFKAHTMAYFQSTRPVNFIFSVGTAVGFLVGFAIVYQVLFSDVSNHLPQYATLKAIGYSDGYLRRIVLEAALILSVLGYCPGVVLAGGLYVLTAKATSLPMQMTVFRGILIFALTVAMCSFSGWVAVRKLKQADPAAVF